jgi:hypothetical protein
LRRLSGLEVGAFLLVLKGKGALPLLWVDSCLKYCLASTRAAGRHVRDSHFGSDDSSKDFDWYAADQESFSAHGVQSQDVLDRHAWLHPHYPPPDMVACSPAAMKWGLGLWG